MKNSNRRYATIQVDVDPFWFIASVYQKNVGKVFNEETTIYENAIPKFLDSFKRNNVRATFFVVGKDLEDKRNVPSLERMIEEGHEIANHGYTHRTDMKRIPADQALREIDLFTETLEKTFNISPKGFKSPAYGIRKEVLQHLDKNGYIYDSSVFPSPFSPLVKAVQARILKYKEGVSEYGELKAATAPLLPYHPGADDLYSPGELRIMELPVSTMPLLRAPFHFSFVNVIGRPLFDGGWALTRLLRPTFLNYAFHAIDVLDETETPLAIHGRPGLKRSKQTKISNMDMILRKISKQYTILPSCEVASQYE